METPNKLKSDILAVLDLLSEKFLLMKADKEFKDQDQILIDVDDLKEYDLNVKRTHAALYLLKNKYDAFKEFHSLHPDDYLAEKYSNNTGEEPSIFNVSPYPNFNETYNQLVERIRSKENLSIPDISFDADKLILSILGQQIKIRKFSDQFHVLRIIFASEDLDQEWFFSDIVERYQSGINHKDKKFYNAFFQIAQKAEKIGIRDLFSLTNQSVKINPKYLS